MAGFGCMKQEYLYFEFECVFHRKEAGMQKEPPIMRKDSFALLKKRFLRLFVFAVKEKTLPL